MATRNDITGDAIQTKLNSEAYRTGWDAIFGNKVKPLNELSADERLSFVHRWWTHCEQAARNKQIILQFEEWYLTKSMDSASTGKTESRNLDDYTY